MNSLSKNLGIILLVIILTLSTVGSPLLSVKGIPTIWNNVAFYDQGSFGPVEGYDESHEKDLSPPWGNSSWGISAYAWEPSSSTKQPIHYYNFTSDGQTAYLEGHEEDGYYGVVRYIQGDVWWGDQVPWNLPWNEPRNPQNLLTHNRQLDIDIDIYRDQETDLPGSSRIMYAINIWFYSDELPGPNWSGGPPGPKRLVMDLIFHVAGEQNSINSFVDEYAFHYQAMIGEAPYQNWAHYDIDLTEHINNALSLNWNGVGPILFAEDTLEIKQLEYLLELKRASAACSIDSLVLTYSETGGSDAPVSDFSSDVVDAVENNVYFIYPDYAGVKPPGVGSASLSDWTAAGFIVGMVSNRQQETTDTDPVIIDTSTGEPRLQGETMVLFGGPLVNAPVNYYENNRVAPLYWRSVGGNYYWYAANGTRLNATAMSFSQIAAGTQDMFLVETFIDDSGNKVYIIYGYGWKGTFAGGKFFKFIIYPDIESYTDSFYVFKWIDSSNDGFVDLDEILTTPILSG
jgi:hypothetical protein